MFQYTVLGWFLKIYSYCEFIYSGMK